MCRARARVVGRGDERPPVPAAAATVPAGFADSAVAAFSRPTAVEWLPDSRIVVLEQDGRVRIGGPTGGVHDRDRHRRVRRRLAASAVCSGSPHDPAFLSNGFVYAYYTHSAPRPPGRLRQPGQPVHADAGRRSTRRARSCCSTTSRRVAATTTAATSRSARTGSSTSRSATPGVDPRGDPGTNDAAQDLSLLNGKILRITLDGHPAPGNPLTGPDSAPCAIAGISAPRTTQCQEIFAWGLRNPYRFAFDRNDGSDRFFINDVGQSTLEEVDLGEHRRQLRLARARGRRAPAAPTRRAPGRPPASGYTAAAHRLRPQRRAGHHRRRVRPERALAGGVRRRLLLRRRRLRRHLGPVRQRFGRTTPRRSRPAPAG